MPDLIVWDPEGTVTPLRMGAALVELDVGYSRPRLLSKLRGALASTSTSVPTLGYILGTTLRSRVPWFINQVPDLAADLPQLAWVEAWWLDVDSPTDRYGRGGATVPQAHWERAPGARLPLSGQRPG